ncbi:MAG: FAD-dependent oxidoreductase, partial [Balneolaceae bacterium]
MKDVIVIGAGIGGLTSAILLAQKGYHVRVFEKNSTPGGKMQERVVDGYRFDTGPSLLTMPFLLEKVFQTCGEDFDDYLQTKEIEPLCRYFYPDHQIFDNYSDRRKSKEQIKHFAPSDVNAYDKFLNQAEKLYNRTSEAFLFNPLYEFSDLRKLNLIDFFRID